MESNTKIKNVTRKILEELRSINATPQTVRYIFKCVRELGKYQVPGNKKVLPDFLNDAEIDCIMNKALNSERTISLLVHMGIFTGLRINELCMLQIQDIDFNNRQLKVISKSAKFGKERYVPLTTSLMQHIKGYLGSRTRGFVFVKSNETHYTKRALQKKLEQIIKACQFSKHLSAHSLRHTYATLLRRHGMTLEQIQVLMGHSSRVTTEIYAHIELGPLKEKFIELMGQN